MTPQRSAVRLTQRSEAIPEHRDENKHSLRQIGLQPIWWRWREPNSVIGYSVLSIEISLSSLLTRAYELYVLGFSKHNTVKTMHRTAYFCTVFGRNLAGMVYKGKKPTYIGQPSPSKIFDISVTPQKRQPSVLSIIITPHYPQQRDRIARVHRPKRSISDQKAEVQYQPTEQDLYSPEDRPRIG